MAEVSLEQMEGKVMNIKISGRIDSLNAPEVEASIQGLVEEHEEAELRFDLGGLEYISSAGLRIFLRLKKSFKDIRAINVSRDVYEILETTGFTEILDVEKAYRSVSVEGCDVIGEGSNGKVYRLDPETIVKVYKSSTDLDSIIKERDVARDALILGLPTAIPYDLVRVGEDYASVFELIDAKSVSRTIAEEPGRMDECIDIMVSLLKLVHSIEVPHGEFPDQRDKALLRLGEMKAVLGPKLYDRLFSMISGIPVSNHLVHGDFHPQNVMLQKAEPIMIDMESLSIGNPVFEFAQMFLACTCLGELDRSIVVDFIGVDWDSLQHFRSEILRRYLGIDDESVFKAAEAKALILGYVKALRFFVVRRNNDRKQVDHCLERLEELLPQVDSLAF